MLSIEMLPAQHGDCLWIEYGAPDRPRRVLVDCGLKATYRSLARRLRNRRDIFFELLVLTHVDADHILGGIPLLQELEPDRFGDVWFNGRRHLPFPKDVLGALHGEIFSALLVDRGFPWNRAWNGGAVVVPEEGPLPRLTLSGGLALTLLSPTPERLAALRAVWDRELEKENLTPGSTEDALRALEERPRLQADALGPALDLRALAESPYVPDTGAPNGSSIALLAEHEGKAVLLAGDAFAPDLERSIRRLLRERGERRLRLDAFKLSHHGSRGNTSPDLLDVVDCRTFLVSTSGSYFNHPHRETIARIVISRPDVRLCFNYRSDETALWDDRDLQREHGYRAAYPEPGTEGYRLGV